MTAAPPNKVAGESIRVRGIVQGVGFRPFVHALAHRLNLVGTVHNDAEGVVIRVAGAAHTIEALVIALVDDCSPLAHVAAIERTPWRAPAGLTQFSIAPSPAGSGGRHTAGVVPDARTCAACAAEIDTAGESGHRYAFASCTTCGPRFSILDAIPYDRANTTMRGFAMCAACRSQYDSPEDRCFHAQPIACPQCGPRLWLGNASGDLAADADPLSAAVAALRDGRIVALPRGDRRPGVGRVKGAAGLQQPEAAARQGRHAGGRQVCGRQGGAAGLMKRTS
jgi:hydrogenase maturation protein HypF